ncbi:hypothetical protein BH20VER1_BH20VER1_24260 [soil metagenome]
MILDTPLLRRVLILADESANWKIAGVRQLDRLLLSIQQLAAEQRRPVSVCVWWSPEVNPGSRWVPADARLRDVQVTDAAKEFLRIDESIEAVLSTRLCLFHTGLQQLLGELRGAAVLVPESSTRWHDQHASFSKSMNAVAGTNRPWQVLEMRHESSQCERALLRYGGKTQDGLVSRFVNRPISRTVSRALLRLGVTPSSWSLLIFALPLCAAFAFVQGTYTGFIVGCAIFQLYSILDGCDGEIARAKFLHTEFGRRLDSFCDFVGNMLLALCLGYGLAQQAHGAHALGWIYIVEGIAAAVLIGLSEGIVFFRRSREQSNRPKRWNGMLYQRHHEFLEKSGILFLGENFAWWLVALTKRDMAMLAFLLLAILGQPEWALHLLLLVAAVSSALAGNAFLRPAAAAVPQEAS